MAENDDKTTFLNRNSQSLHSPDGLISLERSSIHRLVSSESNIDTDFDGIPQQYRQVTITKDTNSAHSRNGGDFSNHSKQQTMNHPQNQTAAVTKKMTNSETLVPLEVEPAATLSSKESSESNESNTSGETENMVMDPINMTIDLKSHNENEDHLDTEVENRRSLLAGTRTQRKRSNSADSVKSVSLLSHADLEICERLDREFERALDEREIGYNARYQSVRQSACFSVTFMFFYILAGTLYFTQSVGWDVEDALFFSIYTMTTVGYGLLKHVPDEESFQIFVIFYIFVGIATLTIMVAQVYQCLALEATRAQHARDKQVAIMTSRSGQFSTHTISRRNMFLGSWRAGLSQYAAGVSTENASTTCHPKILEWILDSCVGGFDACKRFFRENNVGRGISVLFPFAGLIGLGAAVVGPVEGWTATQSIYFACVSLTTVGYGLYVPQNPIAIWFCIFWLPFSVGFMSLFLGNVASFYIRLSDRNIERLERSLRRQLDHAREEAEKEMEAARRRAYRGQTDVQLGTEDFAENDGLDPKTGMKKKSLSKRKNGGFDRVANHEDEVVERGNDGYESDDGLFGTGRRGSGIGRRERILKNSQFELGETDGLSGPTSVHTMRDMIRAVRHDLSNPETENASRNVLATHKARLKPSLRRRNSVMIKNPSFALRVLVQERFAGIIATDIAGYQSKIEIKENIMSVSIDTLRQTADKWLLPRRARKAFRSVAFEALYFVGERGLITRGADALYDLTPFEFHGIMSPLLAAMGDTETMQGWLVSTDALAQADLNRSKSEDGLVVVGNKKRRRRRKKPTKKKEQTGSISPERFSDEDTGALA